MQNGEMGNLAWLLLVMGAALLALHRPFARAVIQSQNRLGFRFGERDLRVTRVVTLLIGGVMVLLGVLGLIGVL